jgi:hypothetical protein
MEKDDCNMLWAFINHQSFTEWTAEPHKMKRMRAKSWTPRDTSWENFLGVHGPRRKIGEHAGCCYSALGTKQESWVGGSAIRARDERKHKRLLQRFDTATLLQVCNPAAFLHRALPCQVLENQRNLAVQARVKAKHTDEVNDHAEKGDEPPAILLWRCGHYGSRSGPRGRAHVGRGHGNRIRQQEERERRVKKNRKRKNRDLLALPLQCTGQLAHFILGLSLSLSLSLSLPLCIILPSFAHWKKPQRKKQQAKHGPKEIGKENSFLGSIPYVLLSFTIHPPSFLDTSLPPFDAPNLPLSTFIVVVGRVFMTATSTI